MVHVDQALRLGPDLGEHPGDDLLVEVEQVLLADPDDRLEDAVTGSLGLLVAGAREAEGQGVARVAQQRLARDELVAPRDDPEVHRRRAADERAVQVEEGSATRCVVVHAASSSTESVTRVPRSSTRRVGPLRVTVRTRPAGPRRAASTWLVTARGPERCGPERHVRPEGTTCIDHGLSTTVRWARLPGERPVHGPRPRG